MDRQNRSIAGSAGLRENQLLIPIRHRRGNLERDLIQTDQSWRQSGEQNICYRDIVPPSVMVRRIERKSARFPSKAMLSPEVMS